MLKSKQKYFGSSSSAYNARTEIVYGRIRAYACCLSYNERSKRGPTTYCSAVTIAANVIATQQYCIV